MNDLDTRPGKLRTPVSGADRRDVVAFAPLVVGS
jgi:hypothetical protein